MIIAQKLSRFPVFNFDGKKSLPLVRRVSGTHSVRLEPTQLILVLIVKGVCTWTILSIKPTGMPAYIYSRIPIKLEKKIGGVFPCFPELPAVTRTRYQVPGTWHSFCAGCRRLRTPLPDDSRASRLRHDRGRSAYYTMNADHPLYRWPACTSSHTQRERCGTAAAPVSCLLWFAVLSQAAPLIYFL